MLTTSVHLGPFPKNLINLFQKGPLARAETTKKQDFQLRQWRMELSRAEDYSVRRQHR